MLKRCTECRRSVPPARDTCMYCGGAAEALADTRALDCPGCGTVMHKVDDDGSVVDQCPNCRGQYFDRGELEARLRSARVEAEDSADVDTVGGLRHRVNTQLSDVNRPRRCPICHQFMTRHNFGRLSGVIVDRCTHGVFLDPGEFERIREFVRVGGESVGHGRSYRASVRLASALKRSGLFS